MIAKSHTTQPASRAHLLPPRHNPPLTQIEHQLFKRRNHQSHLLRQTQSEQCLLAPSRQPSHIAHYSPHGIPTEQDHDLGAPTTMPPRKSTSSVTPAEADDSIQLSPENAPQPQTDKPVTATEQQLKARAERAAEGVSVEVSRSLQYRPLPRRSVSDYGRLELKEFKIQGFDVLIICLMLAMIGLPPPSRTDTPTREIRPPAQHYNPERCRASNPEGGDCFCQLSRV